MLLAVAAHFDLCVRNCCPYCRTLFAKKVWKKKPSAQTNGHISCCRNQTGDLLRFDRHSSSVQQDDERKKKINSPRFWVAPNHTAVHSAAVVCQAGVLFAEFIISSLTTILHKEHEGCVWGRDPGKHHASQQCSHRHTLLYGQPEWPADTEKSNSLCLLFN